jgi:hypothetical protein
MSNGGKRVAGKVNEDDFVEGIRGYCFGLENFGKRRKVYNFEAAGFI